MKHKLFTLFLAFVVGVGTISAEGTWIKISELEHSTIESGTSKVTEMMYFTKIRINFTENLSNYGYITIKSQDTHPWVEICPFYYKGDGGISTVMVNTPYDYYIQENSNTRTSKSQLFSKGTKVDGMIKEFDMNTLAETEGQQFYVSSWQKNVLPDNIEIYLENSPSEPCLLASGTCGAKGDGTHLTWELSCEGVLTVSGTGAMADYDYLEETRAPWYDSYRTKIVTVVIEEGITSIGDYAFNDCENLTAITIPNTVTSIGESAFHHCLSLGDINVPRSVSLIKRGAFRHCPEINISVDEDNQYYTIENGVLFNKEKTLLHTYPMSKHEATYSIPNTVTAIEDLAFNYADITSVDIPEGVLSIGVMSFYVCYKLTSITIPNSVTTIGGEAFYSAQQAKFLHLGQGLTSIGQRAFCDMRDIEYIISEAPTPPVLLDNDAFVSVDKSIPLYVPCEAKEAYKEADGWKEFTNVQAIPSQEPCGPCILASGTCGAEGNNLTWELSCDGVLTISGTGAMEDYSSHATKPWAEYRTTIKEVIVKEGVTSIGNRSFSAGTAHLDEGYKIESLTLPNSLIRIGQFAFFDCTTLASLHIPENVETIGYAAFYDCNLTSVFIPASVTQIEKSAFEDNSFLATMEVDAANKVYDSRENCNAIIETATNTVISGCLNSFIPEGIVAIGDAAFRKCINLTSITFPTGIKTIGPNAFDECSGLTSIELPEGVTNIGDIAFHSCINVTSVTLPNSLTNIGTSAFANCRKLTSVTIPRKVTVLGNLCFAVGKSLTTVNFESFTPPAIGDGCFDNYSCMYYVPCGAQNAYVKALGVYSGRIIELNPFNYSYSLTSADNTKGTVTIIQEPIPCITHAVTFRADAVNGYRFEQWSDGNTDNPRTIELTQDTTVIAVFATLPSDITLQENEAADYYTQFAQDYNGQRVTTATLNRQFTQGKWATLCLPFNVNKAMMMSLGFYNRVFAFRYAQQLDDETIQVFFTPAQSIEAGKGYIVNPNAKLAAKTSFVFPNVTINTDSDNGDITTLTGYNDGTGRGNLFLVGTLRTGMLQGSTSGNTYLGLKDNRLYYPNTTSGTSIRAYRGFFRSDVPVNASRVRIIADGESVTELEVTVDEQGRMDNGWLQNNAPSAHKYLRNGLLFIERNGITYTAQGQRID